MRIVRARLTVLLSVLAVGSAALAACGGSGSSGGDQKTTIVMDMFGNFGFKESGLLDEYQRLHGNITIKYSSVQQDSEYWPRIQPKLNASSGTSDVFGIEVSHIADVVQNQPDRWVDLATLGAAGLEKNFYDWKWKAATSKDGKVLGLGTDIGPLAICYRSDMFRQAGLPTDRDTLAAAWSSWSAYLDTGRRFAAQAPKGAAYLDSASGLYNAILGGSVRQYYDQDGHPDYQDNPAVKQAWDQTVLAIRAGLTAKLKQFDPPWNQAFASGGFATVACPSWMIGYIKGQDKNGAGHWDVAKGPGVGNWGGSYLGIPRNSKHQQAAYDLISWLTAPEQQQKLFLSQGLFPATRTAAESPQVADSKDPYFQNAPTGKIFGSVAAELPIAILGPKDGQIRDAFNNGLLTIDTQGKDPDQTWQTTLQNVRNAIGD